MADVLINHPMVGSLWLSNAKIVDGRVVGEIWNDYDVGSPRLPEDYRGEAMTVNFPVSCVRKDPDGLLKGKAA